MDLGLKDSRALITGGSRGIGFAIAEALAAEVKSQAIAAQIFRVGHYFRVIPSGLRNRILPRITRHPCRYRRHGTLPSRPAP